jgi:hypothetical protein
MRKALMIALLLAAVLSPSVMAAPPTADYVPKVGLVAYYPLNGDVLDWSPLGGHDGTVHGCPNYVMTDIPFLRSNNQAMQMNGFSDYVALNPSMVGDYVSVGLWVNTTTTATGGEETPLLVRLRMEGFALFLNYPSPGNVFLDLYNGPSSHYVVSVPDVSLNDGHWHHICMCYGSSPYGLKIFIDGVARLEDTSMGTTPIYSTDAGLTLSRDADVSAHYYGGLMDEVVFYDRALTPDEVLALYTGGMGVGAVTSSWSNIKNTYR